eukprot:g1718.t1
MDGGAAMNGKVTKAEVMEKSTVYAELRGYLRKKSSKDKWQKRWFEANDHYLTYYKSETSDNLLACIDLRLVGDIRLSTDPEHISEFVIQLGDRNYRMKAKTAEEAERWVKGLLARKDGDSSAEEAANGSGNDKNKLLAAGGKADPKDYGVNDANGSAKLDGSGKVVKAKELEQDAEAGGGPCCSGCSLM